jgi:hypothetical protein
MRGRKRLFQQSAETSIYEIRADVITLWKAEGWLDAATKLPIRNFHYSINYLHSIELGTGFGEFAQILPGKPFLCRLAQKVGGMQHGKDANFCSS